MWHWLITSYEFSVYNSVIHHLYGALLAQHPKSSLLPSVEVWLPLLSSSKEFYSSILWSLKSCSYWVLSTVRFLPMPFHIPNTLAENRGENKTFWSISAYLVVSDFDYQSAKFLRPLASQGTHCFSFLHHFKPYTVYEVFSQDLYDKMNI